MDSEPGAGTDLEHDTDPEACRGELEETSVDTNAEGEGTCLQNVNVDDGDCNSASSSSSSLPSSFAPGPALLPLFCVEEEEIHSGCSKSFTGFKLFTRR